MKTLLPIRPLAILLALAAALLRPLDAAPPAAKAPGPDEPSPQTRTFFIDGVKSDADVTAITAAVLKVKTVTKIDGLTPASGAANISFDHHGVTHQQIAQGIANAGPFKVSFRFAIPQYAANAEKIDALFAKMKDEVKIEATNREKGEFTLTFLPMKAGEAGPHGAGFNLGKIGHPLTDPEPKGLGLKMATISAGALTKPKAPGAK